VSAQTEIEIIKNYLQQKQSENLLLADDFSGLILASQHFSKSTNAEIIYVQQTYSGIPIYNSIGNFVLKNSSVKYAKYDYEIALASRISTQSRVLTPQQALNTTCAQLSISNPTDVSTVESKSSNKLILSKSGVSIDEIPIQLVYFKSESGILNLAWDLSIHMIDGSHWWSVRVDASNGRILDKIDWIVNCNFDHSTIVGRTFRPPLKNQEITGVSFSQEGAVYNVYPYPVESPIHGERAIVINPSDAEFSPFGWHDTDGELGPDFTITRGNNVYAYEDRSATNVPRYSPDGGESLNFDFPLDFNQPPQLNENAAITNLFYWNNIVHDMWSHYGFDEASGNFQQTNYSGRALGDDFVRAEAQDGEGINNANFGTPPDGSKPRMQMFLWSPSGPPVAPLIIETPANLEGDYEGIPAAFGPALTSEAISADFALATDEEVDPDENDICEAISNPDELDQKIVLIRRGACTFVSKILKAQEAGALAVIMVNNVAGEPITMGGEGAEDIIIPSIMVSQADGETIIDALLAEENVSGFLVNNGPYQIDGNFDNGIIAHEYGHGVSNRLTAGAQNAGCLGNEEQMGEGWSDWLGLMMTISADDIATEGRGIGTYAISQETTGLGIRPFRYSTDFSVNPATYDFTNRASISKPHGIGFVWASMIWDLNWALIDQYGFDSDLYSGTGGNNINMQLVIDGMKLQGCSPGFIDGRDAILQADVLANDGINQCLIWEVFAKRGLGWSAEQGSSDSRSDQVEAFDLPPNEELNCALSSDGFGAETFGIYPNPAQDYFNLSLTSTDLSNAKVDIYDLNGKLVLSKMSDSNQRVDVQQLNSGMYVVLVESGTKIFTQKLLVQ
jgi:hypothetical protein